MLRTVKLPHGWDEYKHKLHLSQGGTGETTAPAALAALDGVPRDTVGMPGGVLPLREDSTIDPKYFGTIVLSEITIDGPTEINGGETKQYNITNYDSFTPYFIIPLNGQVTREGPIIFFKADNVRAQGGFSINGKFYPVQISGAGPETPRLLSPLQGEIDKELAILLVLTPYRVIGQSEASWRSTQWQVSKDPSFQTLVIDRDLGEENKSNFLAENLEPDTQYFFRAKYNSHNNSENMWSEVVSARTRKVYPVPRIISPVVGRDQISDLLNFETSPFSPATLSVTIPTVIAGVTTGLVQATYSTRHDSTEWEIAENALFADSRKGKIDTPSLTGVIDGLQPSRSYYLRIRHNHVGDRPVRSHSNGRFDTETRFETGTWSKPIVIKTLNFFGAPPPKILTPESGAGSMGPTVTVTTSKYFSPTNDKHVSTDWEIARDPGFTNIYRRSEEDKENLTRFVMKSVPTSTTYFVRVRFNSKRHGKGQWSSTTNFTTKAFYGSDTPGGGLVKPTIYSPSEGQAVPAGSFEIVSSPFAPDEAGPHFSSDWQISRHSNFNTVDRQLIGSVASKTNWTVDHLTPGTTYFVRVRHNSRDYGSSPWSEPHRFRIAGENSGGDGSGTGPTAPDDRTVEISSIIPTKPRLQAPANNSSNIDESVMVQLAEYKPVVVNARVPIVINNYSNTKLEVSYSSIHNGTDWELSTVESFPEDGNTTKGSFSEESLRFPINGLNKNTTYYLRVRFNHDFKAITEVDKDGVFKFIDKHEPGLWSEVTIFHTARNFGPVAPTITSHTNGQTIDGNEERFEASPYQSLENETYLNTEWQYAETNSFQGPSLRTRVFENPTQPFLEVNDILFNKTYYVRVRHNSTAHKGDWSEVLMVKSETFELQAPTILTPTENEFLEGPDATVTAQALTEFPADVTVRQWDVEEIDGGEKIPENQLVFTKTSPILTIRNVNRKALRVRVKYELYGVAETPWSEWRSFTVRSRVAPNKPAITSPLSNSEINTNRLTLTCSTYSHPTNVEEKIAVWEYATSVDFQQDKVEVQRRGATLVVSNLRYRNYYFRVKHIDQNDNESAWSDTVAVFLVEPAPNQPEMVSPVADSVVKGPAISLLSSEYSTNGLSSLRVVEYLITHLESGKVDKRQTSTVTPVDFTPESSGTYKIQVSHQSEGSKTSPWSNPVEVAYQKPVTSPERNVRVPLPLPGANAIPEADRNDFVDSVVRLPNTPYDDEIKTVLVQLSKQKDFSGEPLSFSSTADSDGQQILSLRLTDRSAPYYMRMRYVTHADKQSDWSPTRFYYRPASDDTVVVSPQYNEVVKQGPIVLKALTGVLGVPSEYEVKWEVTEHGSNDLIAVFSQEDGPVSTAVLRNVDGKQLNVRVRLKKKGEESFTNYSNTVSFRVDESVHTRPTKPKITSPVSIPGKYTVAGTMDLTITSSAYENTTGQEHASTDWQIALDSSFKEVIEFAFKDKDDKLSMTFRAPLEDSLYFARVRHRDAAGSLSAWSDPVGFYSATTTPFTPRITLPQSNTSGNTIGFIEATAYENNIADPLEYQVDVREESSQTQILTRSGALTRGLARLVEITDVIDSKVLIRVRYKNARGYYSKWSEPVSYTSLAQESQRPAKPRITAPELNQYLSNNNFTFTATAFQAKAEETHSFSDWEIVKDPAQPVVFLKNYKSFTDTVQWTVESSRLLGHGKLYVRVRYRGSNSIYTPWSDFVAFNAPLIKPVKPTILSPEAGTVNAYNVTFRISEYIYPDSSLKHVKWLIIDKDTQATLLETTTPGQELVSNSFNGKNIVVKAQYVANDGEVSDFSDPVEYQIRTTPLAPATILKPVEGGKVYTLDPEMRVQIPEEGFTNVFWEVSMFQDFPNFVQQADTGVVPGLNIQSEPGERYLRVRYRNAEGRMSDWSTVVRFTVVAGENPDITLPTPSIELPVQSSTYERRNLTLKSTAFAKEGDSLESAEWEIRDVFTGIAQNNSELNGIQHEYTFVQNGLYKARVRHKSTKGLTSKWSAWREFVVFEKKDELRIVADRQATPFTGRIVENTQVSMKKPFRLRWGNMFVSKTTVQFAKDANFNEILFQDSNKEDYVWQVPALNQIGEGEMPVVYSRLVMEFAGGLLSPYIVNGATVVAMSATDRVLDRGSGKGAKLLYPREADVVKDNPVRLVAATKVGGVAKVRFEVRGVLDDALVQDTVVTIENAGTRTATLSVLGQSGKSLKARVRLDGEEYSTSEWSEWVHFNVSSEASMKPVAPVFTHNKAVLRFSDMGGVFQTEAYSHPNNIALSDTHWQISSSPDFKVLNDWKYGADSSDNEYQFSHHYDARGFVRARYRDSNGVFSDWSRPIEFYNQENIPKKPRIVSPEGSLITGRRATFTSSPYEQPYGGSGTELWTIKYTSGVDNPPEIVTKKTTNRELVVEDLRPDTTFEISVYYICGGGEGTTYNATSVSDTSDPRTYNVVASEQEKPGKPSITTPTAGQVLEPGLIQFQSSAYQTPTIASEHNTSQWWVEDASNPHAYETSGVTGIHLTSWSATFSKRGQALRAKVRHISSNGVSSDWSDYVEFRIASKPSTAAITQPETNAVGVSIESNLEIDTGGRNVSAIKVIQYSDEAGTSVIGEIEKDV